MNYDEMPASREMDALIAEKVMGWKLVQEALYPPQEHVMIDTDPPRGMHRWGREVQPEGFPRALQPYSTDISAAWEVVEKMWQLGWWARIEHQCIDGTWEAEFMPGDGTLGDTSFAVLAPTAPLAICRAALKATEGGRTCNEMARSKK